MTTDSRLRLERLPETLNRRGCGRTRHYKDVDDGTWTEPIHLGRTSSWPSHENDALLRARIAGASREQLRELVTQLHAQRAELMPPGLAGTLPPVSPAPPARTDRASKRRSRIDRKPGVPAGPDIR